METVLLMVLSGGASNFLIFNPLQGALSFPFPFFLLINLELVKVLV